VKNLFRLTCILLLSVSGAVAQANAAIKVVLVGIKTPQKCPALAPLAADLKDVQFPDGWTIYVACTDRAWDDAGRQFDTRGKTNVGMTSRAAHFTIINGAVYSPTFDWTGTHQRTGKQVLMHERGHILCQCNDEDKANKAAGL
jgi:hypothetical protein